MKRESEQTVIYPFVWLDQIVEITLNIKKTAAEGLDLQQLEEINIRLEQEINQIWTHIKADIFSLFSCKKVKMAVAQYHNAIHCLKQQALANLSAYADERPVGAVAEMVLLRLETLNDQLEQRYAAYLPEAELSTEEQTARQEGAIFKILCPLSVDQMGIILKAADDIKLIISRSISLVFRSIAPYLSSEKTKHISWNSMRSSTYHMEKEDIERAVMFLEKLIRQIKSYL